MGRNIPEARFSIKPFLLPPIGQQGDFGRNVLRGFGAWQADVALQREFHLAEKLGCVLVAQLELELEGELDRTRTANLVERVEATIGAVRA